MLCVCMVHTIACFNPPDGFFGYAVSGRLVDAGTMEGLAGVTYGVEILAETGETTGVIPVVITDTDGGFRALASLGLSCTLCLDPGKPPRPRQVELLVVLDECERRIVFVVDDDDISSIRAGYEIDLGDAIGVEPCGP